MNKKVVITIVVAIVVAAGTWLAWAALRNTAVAPSEESNTNIPGNDAPAPSDDTDTAAEAASITFTGDGFAPRQLTVRVGAAIMVRNSSNTNVQFSSDDHPTHMKNPAMNLSSLAPGESSTFVADRAGTWGFHDHLNASHTGTLTVTE